MADISNAKILIIATDGYERSELRVPHEKLGAKATVHIASPEGGEIRSWDGDDWGDSIASDLTLDEVELADYDAVVLPGGQINPDILRTKPKAVELVKSAVESGKTVAAICHGPWLLAEADVIRGRRVTSWPSIRTDLRNAGAVVVDEAAAVDENIVTSRNPDDLDAFVEAIVAGIEGTDSRRDAA